MEPIMLSVDLILTAIIGRPEKLDNLITQARSGEAYFLIEDFALYSALASVEEKDQKNFSLLAELLKYSQIECATPEFVGGRDSWTPSQEEIEHWRTVALE